jgi:hypothetical protein
MVFCWALLTLQSFVLTIVGNKLCVAQDELFHVFPEGPDFVAYGVLAGWVFGFIAAGAGKITHLLGRKRRNACGDGK